MNDNLLKQMEAVRIRGITYSYRNRDCKYAVMDATDANKILLFIKCLQEARQTGVAAVDSQGEPVFYGIGLTSPSSRVIFEQAEIGTVQTMEDGTIQLVLDNCDECLTAQYALKLLTNSTTLFIKTGRGETVCNIDNSVCDSCVEVQMSQDLAVKYKVLILTFAAKLSFHVFDLQNFDVPSGSVTTTRSIEYVPAIIPTIAPNIGQVLNTVTYFDTCVLRAAGYNGRNGLIYFDLINTGSGKTWLTFECDIGRVSQVPTLQNGGGRRKYCGVASAKNKSQKELFKVYGIIEAGQEKFSVSDYSTNRMSTYRNQSFYDDENKRLNLYVMKDELEFRLRTRNPPVKFNIFDINYTKLAVVYPRHSTLVVKTLNRPLALLNGKVQILSFAIQVCFSMYALHKKPMPYIEYVYANDDCNGRTAFFGEK